MASNDVPAPSEGIPSPAQVKAMRGELLDHFETMKKAAAGLEEELAGVSAESESERDDDLRQGRYLAEEALDALDTAGQLARSWSPSDEREADYAEHLKQANSMRNTIGVMFGGQDRNWHVYEDIDEFRRERDERPQFIESDLAWMRRLHVAFDDAAARSRKLFAAAS